MCALCFFSLLSCAAHVRNIAFTYMMNSIKCFLRSGFDWIHWITTHANKAKKKNDVIGIDGSFARMTFKCKGKSWRRTANKFDLDIVFLVEKMKANHNLWLMRVIQLKWYNSSLKWFYRILCLWPDANHFQQKL